MKNSRLSLLYSLFVMTLAPLGVHAQTLSLNSDNLQWEVIPVVDEATQLHALSQTGIKVTEAIPGVVPGTVFTAYVEAGLDRKSVV